MAGALIGALRVTLGLDATYFEEGTKGATRQARKLEKDLRATGQSLSNVGRNMALGVTAPLAAFGVTAVKAAMESQDALAQVEQTIKTMGNAAGKTSEELQKLASEQMHNSLYDDDEILRQVTTTMLTFGKVTGDTFDRAQQATLDLSAKFGKDLQGSAVMVGKALNDPVKGVTALQRVGISFTAQQKEQIKAMVEVGNVAGAQKLILSELENQVAGSAKTAADANPFTALKHAWDDFQEDVGGQLLAILPPITEALKSVVSAFGSLSPEMQKWVVIGGIAAAALGPLLMALGSLVSIVATLAPAMVAFGSTVAEVVATTGAGAGVASSLGAALGLILRFLGPIGLAVGVVVAVWKNWDTIGPILTGLWDSIQKSLGPPLQNLLNAVMETLSKLWNGPLGAAIRGAIDLLTFLSVEFIKAFGPEVVSLISHFGELLGGVINVVAGVIQTVVGLLSGDWSMAWEGAKNIVKGVVDGVLAVLDWLVPGARKAITEMVNAIGSMLSGPFSSMFNAAKQKVKELTDAFYWMYDKVVGHSYVPDMIDEIAVQMGRLDEVMVKKGKQTTEAVAQAFQQMKQAVGSLLARLFPEAAAIRQYTDEVKLLNDALAKGILTKQQYDAAMGALSKERTADADKKAEDERQKEADRLADEAKDRADKLQGIMDGAFPDRVKARERAEALEILNEALRNGKISAEDYALALKDVLAKTSTEAEDKTAKIVTSMAEMARDVVGSLRNMVQAFKSGDILGGIQGILDMVLQVVDLIGMVKGKPRTSNSSHGSPGFSTGGSFKVGGSGGVDSQLVQFRATPGEMVNVRRPGAMNDNNGGAIIVYVKKGEMFDAHVERVARPLAQQATIQGAAMGSALSQRESSRVQRNTLK